LNEYVSTILNNLDIVAKYLFVIFLMINLLLDIHKYGTPIYKRMPAILFLSAVETGIIIILVVAEFSQGVL
jgi:hypothetical protein